MRRIAFIFLYCLGFCLHGHAQDFQAYFRTDQIAGAPQASSFTGASGVLQAKLPSGGVQFSLPLFDLVGQELNLSLSLDYSYDGFRPNERVGWAGMGWSLGGSGGMITRVPFGQLDEDPADGRKYADSFVQSRLNNISQEQDFLHKLNEAFYDSEPDVYVFQFGNYSGKFIHFKDKFYIFPSQNLRITGTGGSGFTITSETGDQYIFHESEFTQSKGADNEKYLLPTYASTWHLSRIQSASGKESIVFQYTDDGVVSEGGYFSQTYKLMDIPYASYSTLSSFQHSYPTKVSRKRLQSIRAPKYNVTLVAGDIRDDLFYFSGSSRMLGGVRIANTDGHIVRDFRLNHSYFGTGTGIASRYLKLSSVDEMEPVPSGSPQIRTHSFSYDSEGVAFPSSTMPNTDRYGYYTGRGNFDTNMIPYPIYPSGPNRSVSLDGTRMGALLQVTYPTGGYSQVEYGLNRKRNGTGYEVHSTTYTYIADGSVPPPHIPWPGLVPINFTIDHEQDIELDLTRIAWTPYGDNNARNTVNDVEIYRMVSGTPTLIYAHAVRLESDSVGVHLTKRLIPGTYRISVVRDVKERWVSCDLTFYTMTNIPIPGLETGGLRADRITDFPIIGSSTTKHYRYLDDAGFDTGADGRPDFAQSRFQDIIFNFDFSYRHSTIHRPVSSQAPPFSTLFYYESVDELRTSGTDTLRSRYLYRNYSTEYLLSPELYSTIHYRKEAGVGWKIQSKQDIQHSLTHDTTFFYLRPIQIMVVTILGGWYGGPMWEYDYFQDMYVQAWKRLDSKRTVQYEGLDSLVTMERFEYGPNHRFPIARILSRTGNDEHLTRYKYPQDYVSVIQSPYLAAHVLQVPLEVQEWTRSPGGWDSTLVKLQVADYHPNYFKPVTIYGFQGSGISFLNQQGKTGTHFNQLLSDSRLVVELNLAYNSSAQTILHQPLHGASTSYRYAYASNTFLNPFFSKGMEVVLQANNATQAECFLEDFEHDGGATTGAAHTGNRYRSGTYSVSWSKPNARLYTLDYWYLEGGRWHYMRQAYTGPVLLNKGTAIDDIRVYPSDALVSSYTFVPGIGLSSVIGPQGHTTQYTRDSFNRLQGVLDTHGKLRQWNEYHDKN